MIETVRLKVRRQGSRRAAAYWEEFEVPYRKNMNVISVLMAIQRSPVNASGEKTTPVVWECNCLEEVCGACSMIINGRARQACSALVHHFKQPITLEPLSKFPVIRDLMVDRSRMFDTLKKINAWITIDGSHNLGPGPKMDPFKAEKAYEFSRCMTCGCCCEACPQFNDRFNFLGAFAFGQVHLFNSHPVGVFNRDVRLDALMGMGGLTDCGNAQNCVEVCPKEIPLTDAIAALGWETTKRAARKLFKD